MNPRQDYRPLSPLGRTLIAAAAVAAGCTSLGAVAGLFDTAGSTPWVASAHAGRVAVISRRWVPTTLSPTRSSCST